MDNKKSKYDFLSAEIVDNYFTPDIELAKTFINKYALDTKRKNLENYIFRIKKQASIVSVLNSKIKKLAFDNKIPTIIGLASRYYLKFSEELREKYAPVKHPSSLNYDDFLVDIIELQDPLTPIKFDFTKKNISKPSESTEEIQNIVDVEEKSKPRVTVKAVNKKETILIIGDLHLPFEHKDYLNFCIRIKNKYKATKIILIGDIIDNHYQSFYSTNPDGYSAGEELKRAKDKIKHWYKAFPSAVVTIGNHDKNFNRKAFANGLSREWIKGLSEVLEVPHWKFKAKYEYNNILFIHGSGSSGVSAAYNQALYKNMPVVMGHQHTVANITYVDQNRFGMIVGSGIDADAYAFSISKNGKKPKIVSCGIITNEGVPIIETMKM